MSIGRWFRLALLSTLVLALGQSLAAAEPGWKLAGVRKIWDRAPHSAFTDLIRFKDQFFCTFREAKKHGVDYSGRVRVIRSPDGKTWDSATLVSLDGHDLRDPKLNVTPDGRLMVNATAVRSGKEGKRFGAIRPFACFSSDGNLWGDIHWFETPESGDLWRVTWFEEKAYGISLFRTPQGHLATRLFERDDGLTYDILTPELYAEKKPTEGTLRFDEDGTCYCLQRRNGSSLAVLGTSDPPYAQWTWEELGHYFGGPNFIQVPHGQWIAGGRHLCDDGYRTVLCDLDVAKGTSTTLVTLPSGGDTSYPGLVWHDDQLWVSYYSGHEGKTSIYLAELTLQH